MRVGFSFVGGLGHGEPLFPLARAAVARGHEVRFACGPAMVAAVEAEGFGAEAVGPAAPEPTSISELLPLDDEREARDLRDRFGRQGGMRAAALVDWCRAWRPDVLVADEVDFGAFMAAELLGLPAACVVVLAAGGFATPALLDAALGDEREALGLPRSRPAGAPPLLTVAPLPPNYRDPSWPLPLDTAWVRPAVLEDRPAGPSPWAPGDRRRVYATLGTIFNRESGDLFARLLAALGAVDADVLVTVGRHLDPAVLGPVPAHVRVERFVPQRDALRGCDLAVTHGGSGSVVGALSLGVPLVVLPMGADQPHNARRVQALAMGEVLTAATATPEQILTAARRVLGDPSYRGRAARLAREADRLFPADEAIARLESLPES